MKSLKSLTLIGGGALGAAAITLGTVGVAGAQDAPTVEDPAPVEQTEETESRRDKRSGNREERIQARVDALIADGTVTQEEVDAADSLRSVIQEQRQAARAEKVAEIADTLGLTSDELQAERDAGATLAEIAGDDLQSLVDLFVVNATERIEAAVESGKITQERADEKLDGLDERIETRLENGGGFGNKGDRARKNNRGTETSVELSEA